jgi:hypothetical protein
VAVGVVSSFFCLAQLVLSYLHSSITEASGKFLGIFLVRTLLTFVSSPARLLVWSRKV